jgi:addiction module HigA family antidote
MNKEASMARKRTVRALPPLHPGEVLREEFMKPMGLKAYGLAKDLQIERPRLERIVREEQGITADTALRLGKYFGTTPEFWMNLQIRYELQKASREIGARLNKIESPSAARQLDQ